MERKFKLYHKAGVREYWVIDPENKGLMVYNFLPDKISINPYGSIGSVSVGILPGLDVVLDQVFAE